MNRSARYGLEFALCLILVGSALFSTVPVTQALATFTSPVERGLNNHDSGWNAGTADGVRNLVSKILGGDDKDDDDEDDDDEQDDDDDEDDGDDDDDDDQGDGDDDDNDSPSDDDDEWWDRPDAKDQSIKMNEDSSVDIVLEGSGDDDEPVTFSISEDPKNGKLSEFSESNGTVTYEAAAEFHGSDSFSFTVRDDRSESRPATVSIQVANINDPPVAVGGQVTTEEGRSVALELKGTDVDGDDLEYVILSGPAHGAVSGVAPDIRYHPENRFDGSDRLIFKVSDGSLDSSPASIKIKVESENEKDELYKWWEKVPTDTSASGEVTTQINSTAAVPRPANTQDIPVENHTQSVIPIVAEPTPQGTSEITNVVGSPASTPSTAMTADKVPPKITLPGSTMELFATSLDGAVVAFVVKAIDDIDGEIEASCSPSSGSTLPIGRFNVICKATDAAGNSALNSFIVVVHGASAPLAMNSPASFMFPAVLTIVLGAGTFFGLKRAIRRLNK